MLASRPLFTLRITLHPPVDLGATPLGHRRVIPVSGGDFEGARLRGTILLRTAPCFETAAERYAWINHIVAVGIGTRR